MSTVGERHGLDGTVVGSQRSHLVGLEIPYHYGVVVSSDREQFAVRRERNRADSGFETSTVDVPPRGWVPQRDLFVVPAGGDVRTVR